MSVHEGPSPVLKAEDSPALSTISVLIGYATKPLLTKHPQLPLSARSSQLPEAAAGDCPTPRMRHLPPRSELDVHSWDPRMSVVWVQFLENEFPVLGWFWEGASPYRDTFFASNSTMRSIIKEAITPYLLPYSIRLDDPKPPNSVALYSALRHSIEEALKTRDYLRDLRSNAFYPIASERVWRRISYPGSNP